LSASASANPKNAVQTASSIPKSALASANSRQTKFAPLASTGTLTLAAASATPIYKKRAKKENI